MLIQPGDEVTVADMPNIGLVRVLSAVYDSSTGTYQFVAETVNGVRYCLRRRPMQLVDPNKPTHKRDDQWDQM
jgi:hypothetical protein